MVGIDMRVSRTLENLVYFFVLRFPEIEAQTMYDAWEKNCILKEYNRPPVAYLQLLIISIKEELQEQGVKFN